MIRFLQWLLDEGSITGAIIPRTKKIGVGAIMTRLIQVNLWHIIKEDYETNQGVRGGMKF